MFRNMTKQPWSDAASKSSRLRVPPRVKADVQHAAHQLVETVLKPPRLKPLAADNDPLFAPCFPKQTRRSSC
jgi:hypothetical protein